MEDKPTPQQKTCEVCEGSGQICSFKGVSRFALTWEDCPLCGGMGFTLSSKDSKEQEKDPDEDGKER